MTLIRNGKDWFKFMSGPFCEAEDYTKIHPSFPFYAVNTKTGLKFFILSDLQDMVDDLLAFRKRDIEIPARICYGVWW
jgi:hypothetical protein